MAIQRKTLVGALPIIVKSRAQSAQVELVIGSGKAKTSGKVVRLPSLPVGNARAGVLALGVTGHECARVKRTDANAAVNASLTPFESDLWNAIEASWIDKAEGDEYPGIRQDRLALMQMYAEDGKFSVDEEMSVQELIGKYCAWKLHQIHFGADVMGPYANKAADLLKGKIPKGAYVRLEGMLGRAKQVKSTSEAMMLAKSVVKMLGEEAEKAQEPPPPPQSQDAEPQADDDSSKEDDAQAGGANEDPNADDDTQQSTAAGAGNEDGDDADSQASAGNGSGEDESEKAEALKAAIEAGSQQFEGMDDQAMRELESFARKIPAEQRVEDYSIQTASKFVGDASLVAQVRAATTALRYRLANLIQSMTMDDREVSGRGNRLSGNHLYRSQVADLRLFKRKTSGTGVDTAIGFLLDASTSMKENDRYGLAIQSAAAVALALEGIDGTAVELSKFPHASGYGVEILCPFGTSLRSAAGTLSSSLPSAGYTPLSEGLLAAGESLNRRKENRKLMLCLHDGKPDNEGSCKTIVKELEQMGIEVFGIGIKADTKHIFDRSITVNKLEELPSAIFNLLSNRLFADQIAA